MDILTEILLIAAIAVQCVAMYFALRLVRTTKYNSVWILFIIGFILLSVMLVLLNVWLARHTDIDPRIFTAMGATVSLCLSVGVMYAHKLFAYIGRLNRRQELFNKRLLSAVVRTEEQSRAHFAKELHDGTGPLLSAAKMSLTALISEQRPEQRRKLTENTLTVVEEAIRSLREISNNMQPQLLKDFGLERGLRNFMDKSVAAQSIALRFDCRTGGRRFDHDVETILYRVVCELINNSLKHSGCTAITLTLTAGDDALTADYTDNGCGFDPDAVQERGMGLSNISSRINSVNGTLLIDSTPGKGMQAHIAVPLPPHTAA